MNTLIASLTFIGFIAAILFVSGPIVILYEYYKFLKRKGK